MKMGQGKRRAKKRSGTETSRSITKTNGTDGHNIEERNSAEAEGGISNTSACICMLQEREL